MKFLYPVGILAVAGTFLLGSCKHDPQVLPAVPTDVDTTSHITDTLNPSFTTSILPIFIRNCFGCHNETRAEEGYILNSHAAITARKFVAGNPSKTKVYEVITDDDEDDRMPQAPNPRLSDGEILLIGNWIRNGAPNN